MFKKDLRKKIEKLLKDLETGIAQLPNNFEWVDEETEETLEEEDLEIAQLIKELHDKGLGDHKLCVAIMQKLSFLKHSLDLHEDSEILRKIFAEIEEIYEKESKLMKKNVHFKPLGNLYLRRVKDRLVKYIEAKEKKQKESFEDFLNGFFDKNLWYDLAVYRMRPFIDKTSEPLKKELKKIWEMDGFDKSITKSEDGEDIWMQFDVKNDKAMEVKVTIASFFGNQKIYPQVNPHTFTAKAFIKTMEEIRQAGFAFVFKLYHWDQAEFFFTKRDPIVIYGNSIELVHRIGNFFVESMEKQGVEFINPKIFYAKDPESSSFSMLFVQTLFREAKKKKSDIHNYKDLKIMIEEGFSENGFFIKALKANNHLARFTFL